LFTRASRDCVFAMTQTLAATTPANSTCASASGAEEKSSFNGIDDEPKQQQRVAGISEDGNDAPRSIISVSTAPISDTMSTSRPNERILVTAFVSFLCFAMTQISFAFIAGSVAMLGDSAAMIVDSMTYGFNWLAERKKRQYDIQQGEEEAAAASASRSNEGYNIAEEEAASAAAAEMALVVRKRDKRKMVLKWETIPPVISVITLIVVTVLVIEKSTQALHRDKRDHGSANPQNGPNVNLMLIFSLVNLVLDAVNVMCFARAKHLMGYSTKVNPEMYLKSIRIAENDSGSIDEELGTRDAAVDINRTHVEDLSARPTLGRRTNDQGHHDHQHETANLNMCSAYTHVFADTLRSIAVIIAAVLAILIPGVTPDLADAAAAIAVSCLIFLSLLPLLRGLARSFVELRRIMAEEKSER
jgi:Co/Zn/Cd efflux system component